MLWQYRDGFPGMKKIKPKQFFISFDSFFFFFKLIETNHFYFVIFNFFHENQLF